MLMLQALNYIHGGHELLLQSLCNALSTAPAPKHAHGKPSRHHPAMTSHFLRAAPQELRDLIGKMNQSSPTTLTKLLRTTNSLKRFATASRRQSLRHNQEQSSRREQSRNSEGPSLLPGASTSEHVLAILLFVWGHHCRDADKHQLKQLAATLGVPLRRLQIAQHWYKLACTYPGLLRLALPGYSASALWENAHDLLLLLESLSQTDTHRDKILGLTSGHLCFECMVSEAESKQDICCANEINQRCALDIY
jgi:hypothetical protein